MLEETVLIWKFNRGCPDALRRIYETHRDSMLAVATALCRDVHAAEDAVQDCFIAFAGRSGQLKLRGSLRSYLMASIVNRLRDQYRKARHQPGSMDPDELARRAGRNGQTPQQVVQLYEALSRLDSLEREVVVLSTRGRMTYKEIANLQNVSIPTVQRRYHSGLNNLRSLLNGELEA